VGNESQSALAGRTEFASLIRRRRRELELTQTVVGGHCGVSQTAVYSWENGGGVGKDKLPLLAEILRLDLDELLRLWLGSDYEAATA
jgi:transcriptional regulator with XRE-family HTH domain